MPLLKYTLLAGSSLLALLFVAEHMIAPAPAASPAAFASLDMLKKMANHGEMRGFAPLAQSGTFSPMPVVAAQPVVASVEPIEVVKPAVVVSAAPAATLDAEARAADHEIIERPVRSASAKKIAPRKPKQPRTQFVENARSPFGFFGNIQSW